MSKHDVNREQENDKHTRSVKDNPKEQGEIPRTRDSSDDDKQDPYKDENTSR